MKRVLILCSGNSARSQMAEGLLRTLGEGRFQVYSAGTHPSRLRDEAITVMGERGIDISGQRSKHVQEFEHQPFDYVITVCDEASAERCPIFPGSGQRLHWGFPDPSQFNGIHAERLEETRIVRIAIAAKVGTCCEEISGVRNAAHC
jgi:arsenate reductase